MQDEAPGDDRHDDTDPLGVPPVGAAASNPDGAPLVDSALRHGFVWPGRTGVGVVLVHDLGASPAGLDTIALRLATAGYSVTAPLLPGHEDLDTPGALSGLDADALVACVAGATAAVATADGRPAAGVVIAGFGLGACAAAAAVVRLAGTPAPPVRGLVTVSASLRTYRRRGRRRRLAARLLGSSPGLGLDVKRPDANEVRLETWTPTALALCDEVEALGDAVWPSLQLPVLQFHARDDHVVSRHEAGELAGRFGSARHELVWLERSFHAAWIDHDADLVGERLGRFAGAFLPAPPTAP
jgi:carboxylesterase